MAKLTLTDIQSGYQTTDAVNTNNALIEAALENTLSRDGTSPNQMNADIDMNGNSLLNLLASEGETNFSWIGDWATSTSYSANNLVYLTIAADATNGGAAYICLVDHTSGTFATDLASNYWTKFAARGATGASGGGSGDLVATQNLSDVDNIDTSRDNLNAIKDVLTTEGDLLAEGNAGPERIALGASGQVLTSDGTDPVWGSIPPVGSVIDFAGTSAPTGWLFCYGQAVSRTTYADLFAEISDTYGVGDGSTTFNIPDLRGRVVAGKDDMGGVSGNNLTNLSGGIDGDVIGDSGGSETHQLTTAQMPAHTHAVSGTTSSSGAHTHTIPSNNSTGGSTNVADLNTDANTSSSSVSTASSGAHTHTWSDTSSTTGSTSAHNNVQPTFILNKIIKH